MSELESLTQVDFNNTDIDSKIQNAINDAYVEIEPLQGVVSNNIIELYAKRITICILLSRLNINKTAVEMPVSECAEIRTLIAKTISSGNYNPNAKGCLNPTTTTMDIVAGVIPTSKLLVRNPNKITIDLKGF